MQNCSLWRDTAALGEHPSKNLHSSFAQFRYILPQTHPNELIEINELNSQLIVTATRLPVAICLIQSNYYVEFSLTALILSAFPSVTGMVDMSSSLSDSRVAETAGRYIIPVIPLKQETAVPPEQLAKVIMNE